MARKWSLFLVFIFGIYFHTAESDDITSISDNASMSPVVETIDGLASWMYKTANELRKPDNLKGIISTLEDISSSPPDANTFELFLPIIGKIGNIIKQVSTSPITKNDNEAISKQLNQMVDRLNSNSFGSLSFLGNQYILDSYMSKIGKTLNQFGLSSPSDSKSDAKQLLEVLQGIGLDVGKKASKSEMFPSNSVLPPAQSNANKMSLDDIKEKASHFFENFGDKLFSTDTSSSQAQTNLSKIDLDDLKQRTSHFFENFSKTSPVSIDSEQNATDIQETIKNLTKKLITTLSSNSTTSTIAP